MIHVRIVYSKHHPIRTLQPPPIFSPEPLHSPLSPSTPLTNLADLFLFTLHPQTAQIMSIWLYIFLFSFIMSLILFHFIRYFFQHSARVRRHCFFSTFSSHTISTNSSWTFGVLDSAWWRQKNDWGQLGCWWIWVGSRKHKCIEQSKCMCVCVFEGCKLWTVFWNCFI